MNRRNSKVLRGLTRLFFRLWQMRRVLLLVIPYFVLLGWLFVGDSRMDVRPAELYGIPEEPAWESPDAVHWFGTTGNGADLFELSRLAMATSVSVAVVSVSFGIALALLLSMLFVFDPGNRRFELVRVIGQTGFLLPSMVVLVILTGGTGGSLGVAILGLILVIAFHLSPVLADWFQEGESGFDVVAGYVLGLSRREIVMNRILPKILRRLIGVFATYVPVVVLVEMTLSFLGLTGDRLSCGAMIAYGQGLIIEAPWMSIYPGLMATFVVLVLTLLGWRVSAALRTGPLPRLF
jgi:ABC-type dipeptide/oligopeptide/nickel transport system permease subunit